MFGTTRYLYYDARLGVAVCEKVIANFGKSRLSYNICEKLGGILLLFNLHDMLF